MRCINTPCGDWLIFNKLALKITQLMSDEIKCHICTLRPPRGSRNQTFSDGFGFVLLCLLCFAF